MSDHWKEKDIPTQKGKTILITGANSGLGLESAKALAWKGAYIVMAVRDTMKGQAALNALRKENPTADAEIMRLNLADFESIRQFADQFNAKYDKLDVLLNNAGVMMPARRGETAQGYELQFGTNHLGHFLLTALLLEKLTSTPHSRIVTVSSLAAKMKNAHIYWNDLHWTSYYDKTSAYAQSKLANQMFGVELQERLKKKKKDTISVLAHPGYTSTNLQRHMGLLGDALNLVAGQSVKMGVLPQLRAATDLSVKGGEYYGPTKMNEFRGYPEKVTLAKAATDATARKRLWKYSEELTGQKLL